MLRPWNARGEMGEDQIVPAVMRDQSIGRSQVDADRPFLLADLLLHIGDLDLSESADLVHSAIDIVDPVHLTAPVGQGGRRRRPRGRWPSRRRGATSDSR